jgi:hypothetical protein
MLRIQPQQTFFSITAGMDVEGAQHAPLGSDMAACRLSAPNTGMFPSV